MGIHTRSYISFISFSTLIVRAYLLTFLNLFNCENPNHNVRFSKKTTGARIGVSENHGCGAPLPPVLNRSLDKMMLPEKNLSACHCCPRIFFFISVGHFLKKYFYIYFLILGLAPITTATLHCSHWWLHDSNGQSQRKSCKHWYICV